MVGVGVVVVGGMVVGVMVGVVGLQPCTYHHEVELVWWWKYSSNQP